MSRKKQKYIVGINCGVTEIVFTRSRKNTHGYKLERHYIYFMDPNLKDHENFEKAVKEVPSNFFTKASINMALPITDLLFQKLTLPELEEKDFRIAVKNRIENVNKYCWDFVLTAERRADDAGLTPLEKELFIIKIENPRIDLYLTLLAKYNVYPSNLFAEINVINYFYPIIENMKKMKAVDKSIPGKVASSDIVNPALVEGSVQETLVEKSEEKVAEKVEEKVEEQKEEGEPKKTLDPNYMLFDLDEKNMVIYIINKDRVNYMRKIPYGFGELVKSICRKIEIDKKEVNVDLAMAEDILGNYDVFGKKIDPIMPLETLFFLSRPVVEKYLIEIQKSIQFFIRAEGKSAKIDAGYVIGDFLKIKNVCEFLENEIKIPVGYVSGFSQADFKKSEVTNLYKKDLITRSFFVGQGLKAKQKFTLLPDYYKIRESKKAIARYFILGITLWIGLVVLLFFSFTKFTLDLRVKIEEKRKEIITLNKTKANILLKIQREKEGNRAANFYIQMLDEKLPIEDFIYQLSLINIRGLYLTNITIQDKKLAIKGNIIKDKANTILTEYIANLEKMSYLGDTNFEIQTVDINTAQFTILSTIAPIGK